jgi:hypothetical protein
MSKDTQKLKLMITRIPERDKIDFQVFCLKNGLKQAWVVNKAIKDWMEKYEKDMGR